MTDLSIIMPIDLSRRAHELTDRLLAIADVAKDADWQLVLGHADRNNAEDRELKLATYGQPHIRLAGDGATKKVANLARLRNLAVAEADGNTLLFLDADIMPDRQLFEALAKQVRDGAKLAMAPCIYLSEAGTTEIMAGLDKGSIIEGALEFSPKLVMHWAMPSSVMALKKEDYLAQSGFFEGFAGHGYEDLEFMLRFSLAHKLIDRFASLSVDRPYRAPLLAEGFRGALATICLPNLFDGNVAMHLYHPKDGAEKYYKRRTSNAELFQKRIAHLEDANPDDHNVPALIRTFFEECNSRKIDPARYYALFDARPRFMMKRRLI